MAMCFTGHGSGICSYWTKMRIMIGFYCICIGVIMALFLLSPLMFHVAFLTHWILLIHRQTPPFMDLGD
jgi:hypothetical protein